MAQRRLQKRWKWTRHWLSLISRVSESPLLARRFILDVWVFCCVDFVKHCIPFVVRLDNAIGDAGVNHLADMLKVNTTLISLYLEGELRFICICNQFSSSFMSWYTEWLCLLRYRQPNWRKWRQRCCGSVESEFNIGWDWFASWLKYALCLFFIHLSPICEQAF